MAVIDEFRSGKIKQLRVSDKGVWQWGAPPDQIWVEVVVLLDRPDPPDRAFGINLSGGDPALPSRLSMLSALRDAYIHGLTVSLAGKFEQGRQNGILTRVDIGTNIA